MRQRVRRFGIVLLVLVLSMAILSTGARAFGTPTKIPIKITEPNPTPKVSPSLAQYLARTELNRLPFSELKNAGVGKMTLFYFPDGRPAYYEVPLLKGGKVIGIMFVPALKTMPPTWMQVFKGSIPISQQLDKLAKERGITDYRYVVLGAAIFGIQKEDGTVIDMAGREYKIDPSKPFKFAIESEGNVELWTTLEKEALKASTFQTANNRKIISGVPVWTSTDAGGASTQYPANVGSPADPWNKWDGCSPIAASMVVAYYDPQFRRTSNLREATIDILHVTMGTSKNGSTTASGIVQGINNFYWEAIWLYRQGYISASPLHSYKAENHHYLSNDQLFARIITEVNNNHPGLLNVQWKTSDGKLIGHSMTFVGYDASARAIYVHTTWSNPSEGWIYVGSWNDAMITTVQATTMCWNGNCPYSINLPVN